MGFGKTKGNERYSVCVRHFSIHLSSGNSQVSRWRRVYVRPGWWKSSLQRHRTCAEMKIRGQHSDRTLSTVCRQLSIVSLVCLLGCDLSHRRAHAVARTREDIQNISVAIQNYVNDRGTLPAEIPAEKEFGMDAKKVYLLLFKNAAPKNVFGEPGQYWIDVGEITDRWWRP